MEDKTYTISQDTIKERKQTIYTIMAVMPMLMVVFMYLFASQKDNLDLKQMGIILAIVIPIIFIEMIIVSKVMLKKVKDIKLTIGLDSFKRISGKYTEEIKYDSIQEVKVKRNTDGKILVIQIKSKKKNTNLSGFENMEEILNILKENINNEVPITEKTYKVNYNSPLALVVIMLLTTAVIVTLVKIDIGVYEVFNNLFSLGFGLFFLLYRPISKNAGARFRIFETIMGGLLVIVGVILVVGKIL